MLFFENTIYFMMDVRRKKLTIEKGKLVNSLFWPLFFFTILLIFYYQFLLLQYKHFGDESETVVTSKMLAHGFKLYSEVFNNHGPLTFLPGLAVELIGNFSVPEHRIPVIILQLLVLLSIYKSPVSSDKFRRAAGAIFAGLIFVIIFPNYLGHTNQYHILAGGLLAIAFSLYVIPSAFQKSSITNRNIAVGNFLIGSVAFLAITYWPALFLIFLLSLQRKNLALSVCWLIVAIAANIAFLSLIGSVYGYIASHFYFNLVILAPYMGSTLLVSLGNILNNFISNKPLLLLFVALFAILFVLDKSKFKWRTVMLFFAISSFFMRDIEFVSIPAFYIMTVFYALGFGKILNKTNNGFWIFLAVVICAFTLLFPGGSRHRALVDKKFPSSSEFSELVKSLTNKGDRIIAYSFRNLEYLLSDRLPASGAFFYLPWQEKYNEQSILGIKIDPCKDIETYKPKVMLIDKWNVWGKYSWDSYAGCIQKIIDKNYDQVLDKPYYVRKDISHNLVLP